MCSVARSWTRAATRPWRWRSCWRTGRSAVPPCRRALRPARSRPCELRDCDKGRYLGKGTLDAVAHVNEEIAEALIGLEADDQRTIDDIMLEVDGTDNKGASGRERHPGRVAGLRQGCGRVRRAAAVQVRGRRERAPAAHAHDEHPQRRRACRQQRGLPGVHDHAGGRGLLRRGAALVRRDLPHAEEGAARRGPGRRRGRRGRLRPQLHHERGAARSASCEAMRGRRLQAGQRHHVRHGRRRVDRVLRCRQAALRAGQARAASSRAPRWWTMWEALVDKYPIISIEDGMAEEDWDGWKTLTDAHRRHACSWWATTCSSPTPSAWPRASSWACANAILIKVNQIGTPHRDA